MGCGASGMDRVADTRASPSPQNRKQLSPLQISVFAEHQTPIYACKFTRDGGGLLSGGRDSKLMLWSTRTQRLLQQLGGHEGAVLSCSVSPTEDIVCSTSDDNMARLWRYTSPKHTTPMGTPSGHPTSLPFATLVGHTHKVYSSDFSSDGRFLLTSSMDKTLRLWDVETCTLVSELDGGDKAIFSCAFSPDDAFAVSGGDADTVNLWDWKTATVAKQLKGHKKTIWSVAVSNHNEHVVAAGMDGGAMLWDVGTGVRSVTYKGSSMPTHRAAFSKDCKAVIACGRDSCVRVWDIDGGVIDVLTGHTGSIYSLSLSNSCIASCSVDQTIRLWDLPSEARAEASMQDIDFGLDDDDEVSDGDPWAEAALVEEDNSTKTAKGPC
ncbi:putative WD repeat-containing protein [Diplonema papillatum]|nr:putative WD repeat-containing protein [Diplonema papillatum]